MVVKKKLDHRVAGFQVAFVPKGPRSARRSPFKKTAKDPQNCAFELLASVAGRLLLEGDGSSASSNACEEKYWNTFRKRNCGQEGQEEDRPLKVESVCQVSYDDITSKSEVASQNLIEKCFQHSGHIDASKDESVINSSNCAEKVGADLKFVNCQTDNLSGDCSGRVADAFLVGESSGVNIEKFLHQEESGRCLIGKLNADNECASMDTMKFCDKSSPMTNSNSDIKAPYSLEAITSTSSCRHGDSIKLGCRDDDENFVRFIKSSTICKAYRPLQRIALRRIRKLLTSKYWKLAPKSKDCELFRSANMRVKPLYRKRKVSHGFEGFHHKSVFKRMKVSAQGSINSDVGFSSNSVSQSLEKGTSGDNNGVTAPSSSVHGHQSSFHSKTSHLKLKIKSFRVPELYVEVPETSTVGSLKRTVMEAVMAILGGGLRVGLLVQGKKIRDDHKTLRQTGIAWKENLDSLGFTLEPCSVPASLPVSSVGLTSLSSSETSRPLILSPGTTAVEPGITDYTTDSSLLTNMGNVVEKHKAPPFQIDTTLDKIDPDSRALAIVPVRKTEPLALVPASQKSKCSEIVQRRTRRPFSVCEVEALVQAVEELGTGRWRDVKLRAFENADHRTYVDLKDKWKTLVHTAKISPQQRRGEPVPQELLNRVLAAHAYWSQHQARQNGKHQTGNLKVADSTTCGAGSNKLPKGINVDSNTW